MSDPDDLSLFLLFVFPEQVIVTVFGNKYPEAWRPLMLLYLRFMSQVIAGPTGLMLVAMDAPTRSWPET